MKWRQKILKCGDKMLTLFGYKALLRVKIPTGKRHLSCWLFFIKMEQPSNDLLLIKKNQNLLNKIKLRTYD